MKRKPVLALAVAGVGGIAFGIVDGLLASGPAWTLGVSNVSSLWLAVAFLAGMGPRATKGGALAGFLSLVGILVGYYGFVHVVEGGANLSYLEHVAAPWLVGASLGGPIFGALGGYWTRTRSRWAMIVLSIAFFAEPFVWILHSAMVRIPSTFGSFYSHDSGIFTAPGAQPQMLVFAAEMLLGLLVAAIAWRHHIVPQDDKG